MEQRRNNFRMSYFCRICHQTLTREFPGPSNGKPVEINDGPTKLCLRAWSHKRAPNPPIEHSMEEQYLLVSLLPNTSEMRVGCENGKVRNQRLSWEWGVWYLCSWEDEHEEKEQVLAGSYANEIIFWDHFLVSMSPHLCNPLNTPRWPALSLNPWQSGGKLNRTLTYRKVQPNPP